MPLTLGQTLRNRYRIDALLGQGGMGAVYRAWDLNLNTAAVVKENLGYSSEAQKQFAREAGLLASLRHPNLPRVTDYFFLHGKGQYLVMDYIEGEDLGQILERQGPVSEALALNWICSVLDALHYLHSRNVIHRDLKPANIKTCPDGQVFLVDFGLAKVYDPLVSTTAGARGVTPGYAPPEQYGEGHTDVRSDIYSVGATLYALLTGCVPPDVTKLVTGAAHLLSPQQLNPRILPRVAAAVLRAMQLRPVDRFQTVAELREELVACQAAQEAAERARRESEQEARRQAAAREQQQRLADWIAQAERQLPHDPAQTLALLAAIRAEQPNYPNLTRLEDRARAVLDRQKEKEEEALRQRERELRKWEADGAIAARQWARALTLAAALEGTGGSGRALAGEIRKAVQRGQQLENQERRERLDARVAEVRTIVGTDPERALQLLAQLRQDAPGHPALPGLERRAQSVLTEQQKRAQAAQDQQQRDDLEPANSSREGHVAGKGPGRPPWRTVALLLCLAVLALALLGASLSLVPQLFPRPAPPTIMVRATPTASTAIAEGAAPSTGPLPTLVPTYTPTWTATVTPTSSTTSIPSHTPTPSATPTLRPSTAGADQVVGFSPGPGAQVKYGHPDALLGETDLVDSPCCQGIVQLGRGGSALVAFTRPIVDGDGPDLRVSGDSAGDDFLLIEVSADGQEWRAYPRMSEASPELDLRDVGLAQAVYVRLTDLQPGTSTGAEVDAVIALHTGSGPAGSLPPLPDAVARQDVALTVAQNSRMNRTGQATAGEALTIVGRGDVAGWVLVRTAADVQGYCPLAGLMVNVRLGQVPVVPGPVTITPTPTATATPTTTLTPTPSSYTGNIAFAVYNAGIHSYTLYTVKPDGTGLRALANDVHQPDYSPDGKRIVIDGTGGGRDDLWQFAGDGSDWHQVTYHPDDHCPTWSPNGLVVAFSSLRYGDGHYRLYANDSLWKNNKETYILGDYPVYLPTWELVFSGCDYGWGLGSECGLWRVVSLGEPTRITREHRDIPTDGDDAEILFLRPGDNDNWDIYRIARGGGNPIRLTDNPGKDGPAAFSPDGKAIAFLSERSGTWALYTMSRAGTDVHKVLDLPMGGDYDAAPYAWNAERISWGALPAVQALPSATPDPWLAAPHIDFPIPEDTISTRRTTIVRWSWLGELAPGQGFDLRFWHVTDPFPLGVGPRTRDKQMEVDFAMTSAYLSHGEGLYYLDVVVVQLEPYLILSRSARIRVKLGASR
jgi:hypothetical protein